MRITSTVEVVCKAMVGEMSEEIGKSAPPSRRAVTQFQAELVNMARLGGAESYERAFEEALISIARLQRELTQQQARRSLNRILTRRHLRSLSALSQTATLCRRGRGAQHGHRQAAVSMSSGRSAAGAMTIARNSFSARVRRWSSGSVRGNSRCHSSRVLATAEALQMAYVTEFVRAASLNGARVFRVSYPGHGSDGATFEADQIPFDVFPPAKWRTS